MAAQRRQSAPTRILMLIIAVVIVGWTFFQEKKANTQIGELEYKMVTGLKNGDFQVIMLETADRFFVLDSAFKSIFDNNDAEEISRPEQLQLLSAYSDLQYRVAFSKISDGRKVQFRVNRDIFNQLKYNKSVKFEVNRKVSDSLNQIIENTDQ